MPVIFMKRFHKALFFFPFLKFSSIFTAAKVLIEREIIIVLRMIFPCRFALGLGFGFLLVADFNGLNAGLVFASLLGLNDSEPSKERLDGPGDIGDAV